MVFTIKGSSVNRIRAMPPIYLLIKEMANRCLSYRKGRTFVKGGIVHLLGYLLYIKWSNESEHRSTLRVKSEHYQQK